MGILLGIMWEYTTIRLSVHHLMNICFQFLVIMNAMKFEPMSLSGHMFSFFLGKSLEVE